MIVCACASIGSLPDLLCKHDFTSKLATLCVALLSSVCGRSCSGAVSSSPLAAHITWLSVWTLECILSMYVGVVKLTLFPGLDVW